MRIYLIILLLSSIFIGNSLSEPLDHECGLAFVRLQKPLVHYQNKYKNPAWGLHQLCSLMEEQRNRGQDGAGIAVLKCNMPPGRVYLKRTRSAQSHAIEHVFETVLPRNEEALGTFDEIRIKDHYPFIGEVYLGHLRYGTYGKNDLSYCQPYMCKHTIPSKNFVLAGNFNMVNSAALFAQLVNVGLQPTSKSDTNVILEQISYQLEQEHDQLKQTIERTTELQGKALLEKVAAELDIVQLLKKVSQAWDGGYFFGGILGNGDSFLCRDPAGIRPGFFYVDDEVVAAASERSALCNVFDVEPHQVHPVQPGHIVVIKRSGEIKQKPFIEPLPLRQCSFERIYFSRSNDPDIYQERKALGKQLAERVLEAIDYDLDNCVFTYIPNSSESAFIGLLEELERRGQKRIIDRLVLQEKPWNTKDIKELSFHLRAEKVIAKNQRMRTFIADDQVRDNMFAHLFNVTKGVVKPTDTLVAIDDSIVRGTTLKQSIIMQLSRLNPKKIIFVSSAPPVMYPDCYGIDMSQIERFIAFRAAVALLKEQGKEEVLDAIEEKCKQQMHNPCTVMTNYVKELYNQFSLAELSEKIAELARPEDVSWQGEIHIIYQTIEGLHRAMPDYSGDWYFTGNYPTPGGYEVLNKSFLNWRNGLAERAY